MENKPPRESRGRKTEDIPINLDNLISVNEGISEIPIFSILNVENFINKKYLM